MDNPAQPNQPVPPPAQQPISPVQQPVTPQPVAPPPPPPVAPTPPPLPQPAPVTPPPSNPIQQKGSFNFLHSVRAKILLGVIVLIIFGGAAFVFASLNSKSPTALAQPTPGPGCHYQEVACIKAPCPKILICTPTGVPVTPTTASLVPTPATKVYTNINGYSITYPDDFLVASDSASAFQIQNSTLTMTFISETATDTAKATLLKRPPFCPLNLKEVDATVSGKIAYQRNGTSLDNTLCMNTLIPNVNTVYDVRGKPLNQTGVDLFNQILNSFKIL